ncbi:DUF2062 domain-containing protein [Luteolibacter ambystomatis]|uniref:DUF2062 domain-containing protein n=1 Tax=Luteolibacter ambystomatis TaxID=2824561 RepID=A0A975G6Z7_9BACT|nr:DUF2062 domain-containing protein [Luteolibacter ambystomatis]QUE49926.1 DUF2062 domain-containing protein [Luteolibacter ambystomatis]
MTFFRKAWRWLHEKWTHLFLLKDRPHAIALGVGLGMFWGFTPFLFFKTLLAMGTSRLFRGNVVAAAIAVQLHDVTIPISPWLLLWEYRVGYWLLHAPHEFPPGHPKVSELLRWSTIFTVGKPLVLGSLLLAVPIGVISYGLMLRYLERREAKRAAAPPADEFSGV